MLQATSSSASQPRETWAKSVGWETAPGPPGCHKGMQQHASIHGYIIQRCSPRHGGLVRRLYGPTGAVAAAEMVAQEARLVQMHPFARPGWFGIGLLDDLRAAGA